MSRNACRCALSALIAMFVTLQSARADTVPWGYSAGNADIFNNNNPIKTSSVNFAGGSGVATGSSGIIIYNMTTNSSAVDASPDSFSNVPFDLAFTLTDINATGSKLGTAKASEKINFSGAFSASNVTTKSLLPGAPPWSTSPFAQVKLGADDVGWHIYSVTLSSFTSPGQPGGSPGSIQAIVTVAPSDRPIDFPPEGPTGGGEQPGPSATPEPGSLVLALLAVPPIIVCIRRRKMAAASV